MERCQKLKQKQIKELREAIKTSKKADEVKRAQAIIMVGQCLWWGNSRSDFQKIWLPKNEYPKIAISNTRKNRSAYGFLNVKIRTEHAMEDRILASGSVIQEFIKKDKNIATVYFSRYSPEENLQEHVWKNGRSAVTHNAFIKNIDAATDAFTEYLNATKFQYSLLGFSAGL